MQIAPIKINNKNKLVENYRLHDDTIMQYFHYLPSGQFEERIQELKGRNFQRKALADTLHTINEEWGAPKSTHQHIEQLVDENSTVVIGGQQAGLLTGPVYTINKVISIIEFARQKEKELQIPVIPVFWIAGEDHDFDEINHIYMPQDQEMKKFTLKQQLTEKSSVSHIPMDQEMGRKWLDAVFKQLEETPHTKDLYHKLTHAFDVSNSFTDFFARVVFQLFEEEGLVLIDSGHPSVRQLEKSHFIHMIDKQKEIAEGVSDAREKLQEDGYEISLETDKNAAHLFYHQDHNRVLLYRNEEDEWVGKQHEVVLSTAEVMQIAETHPEYLSNNVVTRPLMQELLFPTLAFIGGPGEVSYWSVLKPAFEALDLQMPPVVERLSFTYIDARIEKLLDKYELTAERVTTGGVKDYKDAWIAAKSDPPIGQAAGELKAAIDQAHAPLRKIANDMRSDLSDLADKNLSFLYNDVSFLENRLMNELENAYAKELAELDLIAVSLCPNGGLQERIWNPLIMLNQHGSDVIRKIMEASYSFENDHYLIFL